MAELQRMVKALVTIVLILLAAFAQAQKLELGFHAGAGFNTIPATGRDSVIPSNASGLLNPAFSVKALTNVGNWQFGLGMDMQRISIEYNPTRYILANPATTIYLLANRDVGRFFYAGADLGLIVASSANYTRYSDNNKLIPEVVYLEPGTGYAAGLHFGYSAYLGKRLDFVAEVAGRYASYKYEYTETDKTGKVTTGSDSYSFLYPSLVFGLHLKLFTDPFSQWIPYNRVR